MPSIFAYTNYRQFLSDHFEEVKGKNPGFSYRAFCRIAGFTSPNYIRMIVLGTRNLSPKAIAKVAKGLKLNKKQTAFFENLVHFNQSQTHEDKVKHYERLCFFKAYQDIKSLDHKGYLYFSRWYFPVIREMTQMEGFREDPRWIANNLCPAILEDEAREALKILRELELVAYDENKRLRPVDKNVTTVDEVSGLSLMSFHREMIAMARASLENTPQDFRDISSVTVGIDKETFHHTKERLRELRQDLNLNLSQSSKVEAVYQLNLQFFNLSVIPKKWLKKSDVAN